MATQDGFSQADTREFMVWTDQHDREWEGWGDIKAKLHPTLIRPNHRVWNAPWLPDESCFRFDKRNPSRFRIDYDAAIGMSKEAHKARADHVLAVADHFNVPNYDPSQEPTAQMKRELGRGPLPTEPILAAKAGNGYVLGLRAFDPKRPADVKIKAALDTYYPAPLVNEIAEFADEDFADEIPTPVKAKGKKVLADSEV